MMVAVRHAMILLVDDEELVRIGTGEMLSDLGYEVIEATSGAEALRQLRGSEPPDLMITDYLMPGMNGVDLAEQAKRLAPGMKILLITGYSTISEGPGSSLPRLAKPFRQADLAERVAKLLDSEARDNVLEFKGDRGKF